MFPRNAWYVAAWAHDVGREPLARKILGDLTCFRINALNGPGRPRRHPNRAPREVCLTVTARAFVCKRIVNTRYGVRSDILWMILCSLARVHLRQAAQLSLSSVKTSIITYG